MSGDALQLTHVPAVTAEMLVRRPPDEGFRAFVDPDVTTRFWFTKSSGRMTAGADLRWDWEMFGEHEVVLTAVRDHRVKA